MLPVYLYLKFCFQAFTVEKAWLSESMSISPEDDEVPKYQHVDSFLPRVEARERKEEKSPEGLKQQSFPLTYMLFSLGKAEFKLDMNEVENLAATCMLKVMKQLVLQSMCQVRARDEHTIDILCRWKRSTHGWQIAEGSILMARERTKLQSKRRRYPN